MVERVLSKGNKINIEVYLSENSSKYLYDSEVLDVFNTDDVLIRMPFEDDELVMLELNVGYKMFFNTGNVLFESVGYVMDRYKSDNIYIARVHLKSGLQKIQRRDFFRLEKLVNVSYAIFEPQKNVYTSDELIDYLASAENDLVLKNGVVVDLSGGGARLVLDEKLPMFSNVLVKLNENNTDIKPFCMCGKVVQAEMLKERTGQFDNRVEIVRMDEFDRERLVQFIFAEERKLRNIRKS